MVAARVKAWSSSKMVGFLRLCLFGSAQGRANKAFSTFTTKLSVFTDPVVIMIWESLPPGTVP